MSIYRLSTAIVYSTAYRLPIWIAYKISYKHSLYFGIPSVQLSPDSFTEPSPVKFSQGHFDKALKIWVSHVCCD